MSPFIKTSDHSFRSNRTRTVASERPDTEASSSRHAQAIRLTTQAIDKRGALYRYLVVAVVLVGFASLIWALIRWSWWPLLGLISLVSLCSAFFCLDVYLVNRWRRQVLEMWIQGRIEVDNFCDTMMNLRVLPERTLQGLLDTLPAEKKLGIREKVSPSMRNAVVLTISIIHACQFNRTISVTAAYTLASIFALCTALYHSWGTLVGLLLIPVVIVLCQGSTFLRFRKWKKQILMLCQQPEFLTDQFVAIVKKLDWKPIPERKKRQLLSCLLDV